MLRSIQSKVVLILILMILLAMQVISVYLLQSLEQYYVRDLSRRLNPTAQVIAGLVERHLAQSPDIAHLDRIVNDFSAQIGVDLLIVDSHGVVASASGQWAPLRGERYNQLDVTRALSGTRSEGIRPDPETGTSYYHLSVPVRGSDNRLVGAVHVLGSLEQVYGTLADVRTILLTAALLALSIVIIIGFVLARTITGPIRELTAQAASMAGGDFTRSIAVRAHDEIGRLGKTFNYMGQRLQETLEEISREKGRAEAILTNMTDGILALDGQGRVIMVNPAAAAMLGIAQESAVGLSVPEIEGLGILAIADSIPDLGPRTIVGIGSRLLQVSTAEVNQDDLGSGVVIVLHDVTEQERLERMRREFVANVSHELRTPLTTLKSYLETLVDGELRDPENAPRFLRIALDETDRMTRMVKDLLGLSQLDQGQAPLRLTELDPKELVIDTVDKLRPQATNKELALQVSLPPEAPPVRADRDRMEQVLMNLLANALEFTPLGGQIDVLLAREADRVVFSVRDTGLGIPAEDLPRIFERFYRVDKARSREFGGTGLGLAIAREIVIAHKGDISIDSELGVGTTVSFWLPVLDGFGPKP